jgi:hypothetical protein
MKTTADSSHPQQFDVSSSASLASQLVERAGAGNQVTAHGIIPLESQWAPQHAIGTADNEEDLIGPYCKSWISMLVF